jgi:hypothetical protein
MYTVSETVEMFKDLDTRGLHPIVTTPIGLVITGLESEVSAETFRKRNDAFAQDLRKLYEMNETEEGREILLAAYERYKEEE